MRYFWLNIVFQFFMPLLLLANGVAVVNSATGLYLTLQSSKIEVVVEGQVSTTKVLNTFKNLTNPSVAVKYAFPLPEQASATNLRWKINGLWYSAAISAAPQDTTLPGGNPHPNLKTYLGNTPLYFSIPQSILRDSVLTVELTYVQLLPYKYGKVTYSYPNKYTLIQSSVLLAQDFQFLLNSQRTIDSITVTCSYPITSSTNNGHTVFIKIFTGEQAASSDYKIQYVLNATQLGLFGYSTLNPANQVPDSLLRGFFTFIAEPDPSLATASIRKVFTLIIDRSGSMSGTKIVQARDAATFIVNNLNEGDKFNIIDFDDIITSFRPGHVLYTTAARDSARTYISGLTARGMTSISGAFGAAVPQFTGAGDSTANIILFFTDGQPTAGITGTDALTAYIKGLMNASEKQIFTFCFGIGSDVNKQLLTLIGSQNKGFAEFLLNDELYSRITDFYLTVRNPVLLSPSVSFYPVPLTQVYPDSLPNLYKGSQMILSGRYSTPGVTQVTLSGKAFAQQVNYSYNLTLVDSAVEQNQFLLKLWAKRKIESLLVKYYSYPSTSGTALELKRTITYLSQTFGVISPFTSYTGGATGIEAESSIKQVIGPGNFRLLGNFPNPFNPRTRIRIQIEKVVSPYMTANIYSVTGKLIRTLVLYVTGAGLWELNWDGTDRFGCDVPSGTYIYSVSYGEQTLAGKVVLLR